MRMCCLSCRRREGSRSRAFSMSWKVVIGVVIVCTFPVRRLYHPDFLERWCCRARWSAMVSWNFCDRCGSVGGVVPGNGGGRGWPAPWLVSRGDGRREWSRAIIDLSSMSFKGNYRARWRAESRGKCHPLAEGEDAHHWAGLEEIYTRVMGLPLWETPAQREVSSWNRSITGRLRDREDDLRMAIILSIGQFRSGFEWHPRREV